MLPEEQTPLYDDEDTQWSLENEAPPFPDIAPPEEEQASELADRDYADWVEYWQEEQEMEVRRAARLLKGWNRRAEKTSGEAVDIPHVFECGSEEALKQITVAIVQSDSELFADSQKAVKVTYRAKTPTKRAYMMKTAYGQSNFYRYGGWKPFVNGRLQSLCDLAQRLNTFTGVTYEPRHMPDGYMLLNKNVHKIEVVVPPPSMHEQAESLLMLNDWLEGKVRPAKQRRLLGLDAENGD